MKEIIIIAILTLCGIAIATTFDIAVPPDTGEQPSQGAERIRNLAAATQEINNVDHYWPLNGSAVDNADKGLHRKVEFQAPLATPTIAANQGALYIYDYDGGSGAKAELTWRCEDDLTQLQITELNTAGTASVLNITGTYENEVSFTNTANEFYTDSLICTASGVFTLPTDTADTTEANLKYDDTSDTVQYRTASAWQILAASPTAAMIKIGTYTGDGGETKAITGVGFQPDVVFVIPGTDSIDTAIKTTDMGTTYSKIVGTSINYVADSIRSLDADGFTVGNGGSYPVAHDMTESGVVYFYIAAASLDAP